MTIQRENVNLHDHMYEPTGNFKSLLMTFSEFLKANGSLKGIKNSTSKFQQEIKSLVANTNGYLRQYKRKFTNMNTYIFPKLSAHVKIDKRVI